MHKVLLVVGNAESVGPWTGMLCLSSASALVGIGCVRLVPLPLALRA